MSMQLSCVILNYNDAETTEKLVKQIADYDVLHQIIVVDNASTDDSLERLRKLESDANASQSGKVRVISADHNGGYGSGNNLGVRCGAEQGATQCSDRESGCGIFGAVPESHAGSFCPSSGGGNRDHPDP
ncbi:MAG: glycosyltransferase family 2 protein [Clostridium sp.]